MLGAGFLEAVYANALTVELRHRGVPVERNVAFEIVYRGVSVGRYVADLVVDRKVIVETRVAKARDATTKESSNDDSKTTARPDTDEPRSRR